MQQQQAGPPVRRSVRHAQLFPSRRLLAVRPSARASVQRLSRAVSSARPAAAAAAVDDDE